MRTFFFDSIHNTQEFALEELNGEPILVISFHQEKGKGTSNRKWLNADQSLACSLAFNKDDNQLDETLIPLVSGLCFTEVLSDLPIFLKWPNDLVVNDLKVGGVLVERFEEKVCIGIGVNYFWKNPKIPNAGALFNVVQKEESIKEHAIKWAEKVYESMTKNSFSLESYKAKLQTLGKIVEYPEGRGWAEDINENGSLRIKTTEGEIINLTSPLISEVN
tara:strand:+ start:78 stop:734 length:657 start_codon:yes stop_codon:yes gene_type:complete